MVTWYKIWSEMVCRPCFFPCLQHFLGGLGIRKVCLDVHTLGLSTLQTVVKGE